MRKTGKPLRGSATTGAATQARSATQYDNSDRLTQMVDSVAGTITRTYDNFDNLIDEQTPQGEVTYSYDADSRLQTRTVVGETPVSYAWDNAGNPRSAVQGSATLTYAYDSAGRLSSTTLPNGVVVAYTYDGDSRIAAIAYSNGSGPIGNLTYTYDANGRVVGKGGSLASIVMPQSVGGNTFNAANEMTAFNSEPLAYDPNENLLNDGTNTYTWDARNNLISLAGPVPASFSYDSSGRRVGLTINGGTTQYLYENGGTLAQEISPAGVHLMSGLGVTRTDPTSGAAMTFLPDEADDVIALTDSVGAIQTQYSYGPFGEVLVAGASNSNPYQFAGMQNDGTGLYYDLTGYYASTWGLGVAGGSLNSNSADASFVNISDLGGPSATEAGTGACDACRAQLRKRPTLGFEHYYWWVKLQSGYETSIEGEPENPNGHLGKSDWGRVTVVEVYDPNQEYFHDYGCSSDNCSKIDLMRHAEANFKSRPNTYHPYNGPNSNSVARYLGTRAADFAVPGWPPTDPPGAKAWSVPFVGFIPPDN
jgi:YD repeat-containing protein